MKTGSLSGLVVASLLLASCSAGEQGAGDKDENAGAVAIDPASIDPAAAETGYLAQMQGSWVSDDDAKNSITITGSSFQSFTDGALQDDAAIIFVDSCKTRVPDMAEKTFVLQGVEKGGENGKVKQSCYLIYAVSQDKLSYVESTRGRTTHFTRKQ